MTNEEILEAQRVLKAAIGTTSGGQLSPEQLRTFVKTVVDQSGFLKSGVQVISGIKASQYTIDTLGLDSRVMRKVIEGTPVTDTQGVNIGRRYLNPIKVACGFDITDQFLQRNIEGESADAEIQALFATMYMNDSVDIFFNGDTDSEDDFLSMNDGVIVKALADANVHKGQFGAGDKMLDILKAMRQSMPSKWKEDPTKLKFFMSPNRLEQYRDELKDKNTGLGDAMTVGGEKPKFDGYEIETCGKISDSDMFFTMPSNFALGIGEQMKVEFLRQPRKFATEYTVSGDLDGNYAVSDLLVYYYKTA